MDNHLDRRKQMEAWWGRVWDLRRHAGVLGTSDQDCAALLGIEHNKELLQSWKRAASLTRTSFRPALSIETIEGRFRHWVGPTLAHLTAIKRAHDEGNTMAMIVEDSIAPYLVPYWRKSIKELVALVESDQRWHILQLNQARGVDLPGDHVARDYLQRRGVDRGAAAAYVISRLGMEYIVAKYFRADGTIRLPLNRASITPANEVLTNTPGTYVASPALLATDFTLPSSTLISPNRLRQRNEDSWSMAVTTLTRSLQSIEVQ